MTGEWVFVFGEWVNIMAKKKKSSSQQNKRKSASSSYGGGFVLLIFLGTIVTSFYLWGKVQIDFVLRENDQLNLKRQTVQRELDDLRAQVNALKRYERIVDLAKKRGMVPVTTSNLDQLSVDMKGLKTYSSEKELSLRYAGMGLMNTGQKSK